MREPNLPNSSSILSLIPAGARAVFAASVIALAALPSVAGAAHVDCGDSVGPGGTVTLDSDIGLCSGGGTAALTVTGPVTLDMAGHQVRCAGADPADGIRVLGERARIINGSVKSCGYGVSLEGTGRHSLQGVVVNTSIGAGIDISSDRNVLEDCVAASSGDDGIHVAGTRNRVDRCVANNNTSGAGIAVVGDGNKIFDSRTVSNGTGIDIDGDSNQVSGSSATSNDQAGIRVDGDENRLKENDAARNSQNGFDIVGGGSSFTGNTATRSGADGFEIGMAADGNRLADNLSTSNASQGLEILGDNSDVSGNRFTNNLNGIDVSDGTGNIIRSNVVMENANNDMRDTTACASATWIANIFSSSNDPCIE